jgi:hypothetical protein
MKYKYPRLLTLRMTFIRIDAEALARIPWASNFSQQLKRMPTLGCSLSSLLLAGLSVESSAVAANVSQKNS